MQPEDNQYNQKQERLKSIIVVAIGILRGFGTISAAIKFPTKYQYVYSVLPLTWQTPKVFAIFVVYTIHTTSAYISSMILVVGVLLTYFTTSKNAFKMSNHGKPLTRVAGATTGLMVIIPAAGKLFKISEDEKWRLIHQSRICCSGFPEEKICKKRVRSFPVVGVSFSSVFFVKPGTVILFLNFAIAQTIALLINF
ncbi:unnamed protein product [Allacma fusca]|uniref:Uncharacterized protein n=1 Tax=Allacma fusca TaxID=39272 RepID=A0A8J2JBU1_9HEXA|nr:unnamed protein product [Allacma fusca]